MRKNLLSLTLALVLGTSSAFSIYVNPSYCNAGIRTSWNESNATATFYGIPKDCRMVWCAFVLDDTWSNWCEVPVTFNPGDTVITTSRIVPSGSYFNSSTNIWPGGAASSKKPGFIALHLWDPNNTQKNASCAVILKPSDSNITSANCSNFRAFISSDKKSIVMTGLNNHNPSNWFGYTDDAWTSYVDFTSLVQAGKDTAIIDMSKQKYSMGPKAGSYISTPLAGSLYMVVDAKTANQCFADNNGGNNNNGINMSTAPLWSGNIQQPQVNTSSGIPTNGLIGYWPFNGNANDASGHGHNGVVANAILTTDKDNKVNSAYSFSGNGTITVPYHKDFDFSKIKQYSYGCWIYNTTSGNQVYMGKDAPGCQNISFNIQQESTGIFTTGMHGSSCWNTYTSNKSLGVNQWHHVIVSVDSMSLSIYIDGKFINKNQMITPMWGDYVSDIVFGAWPSYHGNERFVSGKIDEVVLYNRAISASEVSSIYNETKPQTSEIPVSGLIGYWPFNGNANDESGHGHNGIVANATLTTDMNNKASRAYYFNGNGTITIPYHKDFDFSKCKQYSYGCWINNSASGVQAYIGKDAPSCQNNSFNFQEYYDGKLVNAMHGSDCWNVYPTNVSLGINQWHHVLVSTDSLSTSIYIDGALIRKDQMKAPMWGDYARSIVFGAWPSVSGNERFVRGKIDDVVIYNRALTANEVTALYNYRKCQAPVLKNDTAVFKICDAKFQAISPKLYFQGTDSVKSSCGCDSIINRYIKYQYATDCCPTTSVSIESLTLKAITPAGTVTINVYPNPTRDHVRVECLDFEKIENYQVKLISASSTIVWSTVISQSSFDIDLNTIPSGVYTIQIIDNQGNIVDYKKIIKL